MPEKPFEYVSISEIELLVKELEDAQKLLSVTVDLAKKAKVEQIAAQYAETRKRGSYWIRSFADSCSQAIVKKMGGLPDPETTGIASPKRTGKKGRPKKSSSGT